MLETLLKILSWDVPAPEILLEQDGDICLEWDNATVSIAPDGGIAWASLNPEQHGTDINELQNLLQSLPQG